ncbi:Dynein 8 kDa light chain, flagellar outer arm [Apostasia shenzhenica]|uniref:Dynein light chain n=1 Tax=Apostasia shenzhenica TaxID=1088818 RepID=A0A2I0B4L4_9ASPA|nr:Dynein 8 kDa light chain, flagellar outer arm [Apostasia shenzhenica]
MRKMVEEMGGASEELERRSRYLSSLIQRSKIKADADQENDKKGKEKDLEERSGGRSHLENQLEEVSNIRVRAADMPMSLQRRAFCCAREVLSGMPKLDSKRLALALKKEFDSSYGPAWHCIVGTSFGSYVTHSLGGFLYFSIDKVYILLFRTAVEPLDH